MENPVFKKLLFKRKLFAILFLIGFPTLILGTVLSIALDSKAQDSTFDAVFFWVVLTGGIVAIVSLVLHANYAFEFKYRSLAQAELSSTDIFGFNFKVMRRATELYCDALLQK